MQTLTIYVLFMIAVTIVGYFFSIMAAVALGCVLFGMMLILAQLGANQQALAKLIATKGNLR